MSLTAFGAILRLSAFARADMAIPNATAGDFIFRKTLRSARKAKVFWKLHASHFRLSVFSFALLICSPGPQRFNFRLIGRGLTRKGNQ
jgi:hypothetical protein